MTNLSRSESHDCLWCEEKKNKSLTSSFSVAEMRRHRQQPLLSGAHAPQALIQPVDHLVAPQHRILNVLMVVSEDEIDRTEGQVPVLFLFLFFLFLNNAAS